MGAKLGSSGYDSGDSGGSYGDYAHGCGDGYSDDDEHGVSLAWVHSKTLQGAKNASPERLEAFRKKANREEKRTQDKFVATIRAKKGDAATHRASMTKHKWLAAYNASKDPRLDQMRKESGWAKWRAKKGK